MVDTIFSRSNKQTYAVVDYSQGEEIEFYFCGRIIENSFPTELLTLIEEYNGTVDEMALSLVDEVEEEIYAYDLGLKARGSTKNGVRVRFLSRKSTLTPFFDPVFQPGIAAANFFIGPIVIVRSNLPTDAAPARFLWPLSRAAQRYRSGPCINRAFCAF